MSVLSLSVFSGSQINFYKRCSESIFFSFAKMKLAAGNKNVFTLFIYLISDVNKSSGKQQTLLYSFNENNFSGKLDAVIQNIISDIFFQQNTRYNFKRVC